MKTPQLRSGFALARNCFQFLMMLVLVGGLFLPGMQAQADVVPTFSISTVVTDSTVTVLTYNFPAGKDWTVRMGNFGTLAIGGTIVGTINSGSGGSFTATFDIPDWLKGSYQIAIRMDSTTGGYYAYNWFYNNPSGYGTGGPYPTVTPGPTAIPGYYGIPTFNIQAVVRDTSVTVLTNNFPAGLDFTVRMGPYGTQALGGVVVGTINSGSGGAFTATFNVPDAYKGSDRIAIRMDSTIGYYAYNWFWNNTTGGGTGGPVATATPGGPTATPAPTSTPAYTGIPTFNIQSVVRDSSVTILTNNFPVGLDFTVTMGPYGSKGIGGVVVGTINSGSGGAFTATFTVPDAYKGSDRIAIRLESSLGYYAFNWFWNNTTG
ncbi:MAG: hypothetical protein VB089_03510 [Anaerolineaceae bacterium]|jgi:hypothetical protein|nr:hypothetical protein [Anaerolineaceae bacterium]